MDETDLGPSHDESNLLDSPDYWLDHAEDIIKKLLSEIEDLKKEKCNLEQYKIKYNSLAVTLGLELEKIDTTPTA